MCSLKAAWAPGGLHEGPGWPRGGSRGAAWRVQNVDFSLVFIVFSRFPCILRFGSWIWCLVALMSCQNVLFEGCLGARRAPRGSRMALARLQKAGLEGGKCGFSFGFIRFSRFPCILRFCSCFWRLWRSVKLNDDPRDLSVSHSHASS